MKTKRVYWAVICFSFERRLCADKIGEANPKAFYDTLVKAKYKKREYELRFPRARYRIAKIILEI